MNKKNLKHRIEDLHSSDYAKDQLAADILRQLFRYSEQHNPEIIAEASKIASQELNEAATQ